MHTPPDNTSKSGRNRTPQPVSADHYVGVALRNLVVFFLTYRKAPRPEGLPVAMERIIELQLLTKPEHRYGLAGAIHAIFHLHPPLVAGWRARWPKQMAIIDGCKPPEADNDVSRAAEIDYLWMYGQVTGDEYTIDRLIRIGMRTDAVGQAAVIVIHHNAGMPLMMRALLRARASTTTSPPLDASIPSAAIRSLAHFAATTAPYHQMILYVGWRHPQTSLGGNRVVGKLVIRTPDGQIPEGFPTMWESYHVAAEQASQADLDIWRSLDANRERP